MRISRLQAAGFRSRKERLTCRGGEDGEEGGAIRGSEVAGRGGNTSNTILTFTFALPIFIIWAFNLHRIAPLVNNNSHHLVVEPHNISNSQTDSDYSNNTINIKDSFNNDNATNIFDKLIDSFDQKKKLNNSEISQNNPIENDNNERTLPPLDRDCFKPNPNVVVNRNYNASLSKTTETTKKSDYLPYPAVVVGFPKAGTSSIHALFKRSGLRSLHWDCPRMSCGKCIEQAVYYRKPSPLRYCSKKYIHEKNTSVYDAWTQIDYGGNIDNDDYNSRCYWPQVQALEEISRGSPNATFILNMRNFYRWWSSVQRWGNMAIRISRCSFFEGEATEENFKDFFCGHVERIRAFVRDHPSHAMVEIDIEDPMTGRHLERLFRGVNASIWGKRNENKNKELPK